MLLRLRSATEATTELVDQNDIALLLKPFDVTALLLQVAVPREGVIHHLLEGGVDGVFILGLELLEGELGAQKDCKAYVLEATRHKLPLLVHAPLGVLLSCSRCYCCLEAKAALVTTRVLRRLLAKRADNCRRCRARLFGLASAAPTS